MQVHNLSGPFRVEDKEGKPAMPGDLLVVEICDLGPLMGYEWGFTGIFDRENGGGFLTDHFPEACKAIWDFEGIYCSSRHVPGGFSSIVFTLFFPACYVGMSCCDIIGAKKMYTMLTSVVGAMRAI